MIKDVEGLAKKAPTYVTDFESWAEDNKQFAELNDKYDLTDEAQPSRRARCPRSWATAPPRSATRP